MSFAQKSLKRKNVKGLGLALNAAPRTPIDGEGVPLRNSNNVRADDAIDIGIDIKLDLKNEDLQVLKELGAGNGGTVAKVQHVSTKAIMARKVNGCDVAVASNG
jgi:mitogen-activated protein kinase kinase